ncbi:hypothetical protein GCM10023333_05850 [Ferrimonas pelagia]|uniref:Uncharacterized protein n=1 Tax=Ferrimonas pelagia TaxID=1177826 RepID=A0ABP9EFK6_9GAMM
MCPPVCANWRNSTLAIVERTLRWIVVPMAVWLWGVYVLRIGTSTVEARGPRFVVHKGGVYGPVNRLSDH